MKDSMNDNGLVILRVILIHAAVSIGILTYYFLNKVMHDESDGLFVNPHDFQAAPVILICLSAIISVEIGTNAPTRLYGALIAASSNSLGSISYFLAIIIMDAYSSNSSIHTQLIVICFVSGFVGSLAGSLGTKIPFTSKITLTDYHSETNPKLTEIHISSLLPGGRYVDGQNGEVVYLAPDGTAWTQMKSGSFIQTT